MPKYFEFRVSLRHISPPIWRRFLLRSSASFEDLHHAIQRAFGWGSYHLWEFQEPQRRGEPIAGPLRDGGLGFGWDEEIPEASRIKLSSYFGPGIEGRKCVYIYDFGDDWHHQVTFRKQITDSDSFTRRLLSGKRTCPPEDCGGVPGYYEMVQFVETGDDGDRDELREWLGDWDPEDFDLEDAQDEFDC